MEVSVERLLEIIGEQTAKLFLLEEENALLKERLQAAVEKESEARTAKKPIEMKAK